MLLSDSMRSVLGLYVDIGSPSEFDGSHRIGLCHIQPDAGSLEIADHHPYSLVVLEFINQGLALLGGNRPIDEDGRCLTGQA